jgi:hypothetical protein
MKSMSVKAFFDTNIIVYTQRTDAPEKTRVAENAWLTSRLWSAPKPLADMEQLLDSIAGKKTAPVTPARTPGAAASSSPPTF